MTRNREIDLEDLAPCAHEPAIAVSDGRGGIDHWICRCGQKAQPSKVTCADCGKTRMGVTPRTFVCRFCLSLNCEPAV